MSKDSQWCFRRFRHSDIVIPSDFVIRHSDLRMHRDYEPTPNPSQEGNGHNADVRLLPSWEGSGVGRFMESASVFVDDDQSP